MFLNCSMCIYSLRNIRGQGLKPWTSECGVPAGRRHRYFTANAPLGKCTSWKLRINSDVLEMEPNLENSIRCELCERSFGRQGHLDRHVRSHLNRRPFRCDGCDQYFSRRYVGQEEGAFAYIVLFLYHCQRYSKPPRCHKLSQSRTSSHQSLQ